MVFQAKDSIWNDPKAQAALERLAAEKMSASQIGEVLGVTRNAIIGRAHRTGVVLNGARDAGARPRKAAVPKPRKICVPREKVVRDGPTSRRYPYEERVAIVAAVFSGENMKQVAMRWRANAHTVARFVGRAELWNDAMERAQEIMWVRDLIVGADLAEKGLREREAATRRNAVNEPILCMMPPRHYQMINRRMNGSTLQEVADAFGVSRERVRQIEVKWRVRGLQMPDEKPLSDAAIRLGVGYIPTGKPRGRPPKNPKPKRDVFAMAHAIIDAEVSGKQRKTYTITDEDRQRRADRMRKMWDERRA